MERQKTRPRFCHLRPKQSGRASPVQASNGQSLPSPSRPLRGSPPATACTPRPRGTETHCRTHALSHLQTGAGCAVRAVRCGAVRVGGCTQGTDLEGCDRSRCMRSSSVTACTTHRACCLVVRDAEDTPHSKEARLWAGTTATEGHERSGPWALLTARASRARHVQLSPVDQYLDLLLGEPQLFGLGHMTCHMSSP